MNKTVILLVDAVVAIALLVIAVIYFTHPANQLPHWLPGHSATDAKKHVKHGIGAVIVALGVITYGWFATGPKPPATSSTPQN
jgi:amino acid permease